MERHKPIKFYKGYRIVNGLEPDMGWGCISISIIGFLLIIVGMVIFLPA